MFTKATVSPIGDEHKDGNPHLTDQGMAIYLNASEASYWGRSAGWFIGDGAGVATCADEGPIGAGTPTVVITLS